MGPQVSEILLPTRIGKGRMGFIPGFIRPRSILRNAPRCLRPRRRRWRDLRRRCGSGWRCGSGGLPGHDSAVGSGAETGVPLLGCTHVCGGACWADAGAGAGFEGGEVAGLAEAGGVGPAGG